MPVFLRFLKQIYMTVMVGFLAVDLIYFNLCYINESRVFKVLQKI